MLDFNNTVIARDTAANQLFNQKLNSLIDAAIGVERQKQKGRRYLGASRLGVSCARMLQYEYLADPTLGSGFKGQILRIFEAGHLFEILSARWLRLAGFLIDTHDLSGKQFGFTAASGKIAGHIDGVIRTSPPELNLACPALWEAKSMNSRSWKETVKKGLVLSKPIYAAQIALYQAYMEESIAGISQNPCLFTAINKDTAEIYHELIPFDATLAQNMSDKAVNIIRASDANELLPRAFNSKDYFECKMCNYCDKCWG